VLELSVTPLAVVLTVVGDLDLVERDAFPDLLTRARAARRPLLVVDGCRLTFLDSTGAALLTTLAVEARERGGQAVLRGASSQATYVLGVLGALALFRVDAGHRCEPGEGNSWEAAIRGA